MANLQTDGAQVFSLWCNEGMTAPTSSPSSRSTSRAAMTASTHSSRKLIGGRPGRSTQKSREEFAFLLPLLQRFFVVDSSVVYETDGDWAAGNCTAHSFAEA